jgi:hypothetical protein
MKIEKEVLMKHHFWILTGCVVPLALFAFVWLPAVVGGDNDDDKQKIKKAEDALKAANDPTTIRNQQFLDELNKKDVKLAAQKNKIWKDVWDAQNELFTLPEFPSEVKDADKEKIKALAFGESFSAISRDLPSLYETSYLTSKGGYVRDVYEKQVPIAPTLYRGLSGDHAWEGGVIRYVREWKEHVPEDEEIWLAQEDLWVQRELLRAIAQTNDGVAWFTPVEEAELAKLKLEPGVKAFHNPYWRMELKLEGNKLVGKITNVSKRRQPLNATFWVQIHPKDDPKVPFHTNLTGLSGPEFDKLTIPQRERLERERLFGDEKDFNLFVKVHVSRATMAVGATETLDPVPIKGRAADIFGVFQQLKLETVPVKSLEELRLSYNSDRTSNRPLIVRADKKAPATASGGGRQPPPGPGGKPPEAPADPSKMGERGDSGNVTKNGLDRKRYNEVTDQVRRMPVALVLLVDQDFVQDVLRSLANSKLRMQTTQVYWTHPDTFKPGGGGRPDGRPSVGPGAPVAVAGGPTDAGKARNTDDQESGAVELVFYGIISLYERPAKESGQGQKR